MASRDPKDLPAHLRPLFKDALPERAAATLERVLGGKSERISTSRVGRAFKLSGLAMKSGSKLLLDKARDVIGKPDGDSSASVEVASDMLRAFSELRGISMKLGQMLSYLDDALPPEARRVLAVLQRDASPMPWETAKGVIEAELSRSVEEAFLEIDETPIAAASIGQVHRARLPDGTPVAVKVQYPGIAKAMASDLKNARVMALFKGMFFFRTDTTAIMNELEERFLDECDYSKEAEYQEAYRARLAGHPWIVVPEVHRGWSTKKVLTTTFYDGITLYEWLETAPSADERQRVTRMFYRFYLGSLYMDGLFNCDPHPGNYLFLPDGRIVFLDYGCSRRYPKDRLAKWIALCKAVYEDDREALHLLVVEMDFVQPGQAYDREALRDLMRYLYMPYLTDGPFHFSEHRPQDTFRRMFVENPNLFKLNMPAEAVFLNRIGFGLVSLLTQIDSSLDCRRYVSHYFEGIDLDWPEDPFRPERAPAA